MIYLYLLPVIIIILQFVVITSLLKKKERILLLYRREQSESKSYTTRWSQADKQNGMLLEILIHISKNEIKSLRDARELYRLITKKKSENADTFLKNKFQKLL